MSQVQAVQVYPMARAEAEAAAVATATAARSGRRPRPASEDIFVAQLHLRASLLDDGFQVL